MRNKFLLISSFYIFIILIASAVSILKIPIISSTGESRKVFEIFGVLLSISAFIILLNTLNKLKNYKYINIINIVLPYLFFNLSLLVFVEFSTASSDYKCYENASIAILNLSDLYKNTGYLYPPFLAELIVVLFKSIQTTTLFVSLNMPANGIFFYIFFLYQAFLYFVYLLSTYLTFRLCRLLKVNNVVSVIFATILFLINNPVIRNYKFNQPNILLLLLILSLIVLDKKYDFLIGFLLGLTIVIKLYPILFILPIVFYKRLKIITGLSIFLFIYFFCSLYYFGYNNFQYFISFIKHFPHGTLFRDNSIYSVVFNFLSIISLLSIMKIIIYLLYFLIVVYFLLRIRNIYKTDHGFDFYKIIILELSAFMLLVSPIVWEHHYVIIIPFFIYQTIKLYSLNKKDIVIIVFLLFILPTFDFFPFSYNRISGLVYLLLLSYNPFTKIFQRVETWKRKTNELEG